MAVATHVSRVSKEYAPFGYSIMEDVVVRFSGIAATGGGGDDNETIAVYVATDADSYVDSASVVFDSTTAGDATWDVQILNQTAAGAPALNSVAADTESQTEFTEVSLNIDQNQVISKGDVLSLDFTEDGTAGTALPDGMVLIRIRRKA